MPTTLDLWLIGENLEVITITDQVLTAGVLSDGTAYDLVGEIMSVEPMLESVNQDIRPVNEPNINEIPISHGDSLRIGVLQRTAELNKLQNAIRTSISKRFLIQYTQDVEDLQGYYTFRRWTGGINDRGQNLAVAEFGPCKPKEVPQVTYALAT